MRRITLFATVSSLALLLVACGGGPVELMPSVGRAGALLPVSEGTWFYDLTTVDVSSGVTFSVDVGASPTDVALIFVNRTNFDRSAPVVEVLPSVTGGPIASSTEPAQSRSLAALEADSDPPALRGHPDAMGWEPPPLDSGNALARSFDSPPPPSFALVGPPGDYEEGNTADFSLSDSAGTTIGATLALIVDDTAGPSGVALEVWVETADWNLGAGPVTQLMVEALAERFLKVGPGGDAIYDWVTAIFGREWGAQPYAILIGDDRTVTILLHDIEGNGAGGIVGYYWAKDNYRRSSVEGSNERVMFYLDSASLVEADDVTWSIEDRWPAEIVSTLAHEFQHMIHFYQRRILRGAESQTWLEELMSLSTEDLVAEELGIGGPRGVDPIAFDDGSAGPDGNSVGRIPGVDNGYNAYNDTSLTTWTGPPYTGERIDLVLRDYAVSYAFGAYLMRNFGGAELMTAMMESSSSDGETVVQDAVYATTGFSNATLRQLMWRWAVAVLRSGESVSPPFRLNPGTWMTSSAAATGTPVSFKLGSINHYLYSPPPFLHTDVSLSTMAPNSKILYAVGSGLTGRLDFTLSLPAGIDIAVATY